MRQHSNFRSALVPLAASAILMATQPKLHSQAPPPSPDLSQPSAEQPARAQSPIANAPKATRSPESINADLVKARAATADKQFELAESLMNSATHDRPDLIYPWIELGLAQMGLKKYPEAEISFKIALGEDPETQKQVHSEDFYKEGSFSTQISRNTAAHEVVVIKRTPEIEGICLSSLGEIYIRTKRVPLAKEAFDRAVKADPTKAPLFLRNEATFFFQIGDAADQVEAANKAIEVDPAKAILYYFKAQGLAGQAVIDPKTQKLTLPPGCAEAYQKYLQLDPTGQFAPEAKSVLTAASLPTAAH